MNSQRRVMRFGIPTLDRLIGYDAEGQDPQLNASLDVDRYGFAGSDGAGCSFCLIGQHGTGKSVLTLHFASQYLADCLADGHENVRVLYVSTDLAHSMAQNVWESFALNTPNARIVPFAPPPKRKLDPSLKIALQRRTPHPGESSEKNLQAQLRSKDSFREVTFVDLAAETAGDDWGFVHRLIAVLDEPKAGPRHLVIVDAVEGLETLVGERDAFGEKTSRRARIAQMLRTAFRKCHLFFVVEEPAEGERVPEEFVSDAVIRLHSIRRRDFDLRTVEVQKVRGQGHIRGQHPYVIRRGVGSFTGSRENPDDPCVAIPVPAHEAAKGKRKDPAPSGSSQTGPTVDGDSNHVSWQAYVHVLHSLHYLTRNNMLIKGTPRPDPTRKLAGFGIPHLDAILARNESNERGLPCSTVTALIGDAGTHKSALGNAFLYQGLRSTIFRDPKLTKDQTLGQQDPVAVLLTTSSDSDADSLARQFLRWAWVEAGKEPEKPENQWFFSRGRKFIDFAGCQDQDHPPSPLFAEKLEQLAARNIICRRLEIHNQTSEGFMHIVQQIVAEAQKRIDAVRDRSADRYQRSWPLRLVIDDFSILRNTYAALREDSLFLPFLVFFLKRDGISTLIIETNPGQPDREGPALSSDELRAMADNHLYTWRVAFHGESRIAISAIPPLSPDQRSRVRELHCYPHHDVPPTVDRELELYAELEQRNPRLIPLEVCLYAETDLFPGYIDEMNRILGTFFVPLPPGPGRTESSLVKGMKPNQYAYLHDFCNLQSEHSLDHTLIVAVDEFWAVNPRPGLASGKPQSLPPLRDEGQYLEEDLDVVVNEPRQLFRGLRRPLPGENIVVAATESGQGKDQRRGSRMSYFRLPGYDISQNAGKEGERETLVEGVDRIPFAWDFGFLMCPEMAWRVGQDHWVHFGNETPKKVATVLNALPHTKGHLHNERVTLDERNTPRPSWREFLGACQVVAARLAPTDPRPLPFDISTVNGEAFSCLILEMWASEIVDRLGPASRQGKEFCGSLSTKRWMSSDGGDCGLIEWLGQANRVIDLYLSWLLLVDLLPLGELANPQQPTRVLERAASPTATASRQWYKGACQLLNRSDSEPMQAVGLPGHFSVRGDWFLGVARGSRSDLLADRVLDILSSRRNNLTRLYSGIGLPTRILGTDEVASSGRLMTALTWKSDAGEPRTVRYGPLRALGASEPQNFHWLFRSALRNYHRHARIFQRWNSRTILMWNQTKTESGVGWRPGLDLYDELMRGGRPNHSNMDSKLSAAIETLGKKEPQEKPKPGSTKNAGAKHTEVASWTHFKARCAILRDLLIKSDTTGPAESGRKAKAQNA